MTVTGIIAECNPFHEGHAYLIRKAREITGADFVIAALSGDYVQRGLPAVMPWEYRVRELLANGADLVIALPLYVSTGAADYFARGGVALLEGTGVVTDIVFGSETGDLAALYNTADALLARTGPQAQFDESLRSTFRGGGTFAGALADTAGGALPHTPNDLLGAHYLKALSMSGSGIRPHAVPRIACPSASERRQALVAQRARGQNTAAFPVLSHDDLSGALLHALVTNREYSAYLDVSEDLSNRIRALLPSYRSYGDFAAQVKTRNVTHTRVNRALLHILLGMRQDTMRLFDESYGLCGWIRPLGMRRSAAELLLEIKKAASVPYLDKLSRAQSRLDPALFAIFDEEIRAELLYDIVLRASGSVSGCTVHGTGPDPCEDRDASGTDRHPHGERDASGTDRHPHGERDALPQSSPAVTAYAKQIILAD